MNKKGVTLLELIIVMVIIAIGATLLAPNIGAWIPIYRLKGATRDVVSTLRTAQMKAISINTDYQVNFLTATTYVIEYRNTLGNFVAEGSQQTLPTGIEFTTFPRIFRFNPNSTAWISGGLTIKNTKGSTRTITLSTSTGKIIMN
jgi:prepilin-type N-terminal cleavage/methylation domain-containing protein